MGNIKLFSSQAFTIACPRIVSFGGKPATTSVHTGSGATRTKSVHVPPVGFRLHAHRSTGQSGLNKYVEHGRKQEPMEQSEERPQACPYCETVRKGSFSQTHSISPESGDWLQAVQENPALHAGPKYLYRPGILREQKGWVKLHILRSHKLGGTTIGEP